MADTLMESKMLAALTGKVSAIAGTEYVTREEMVAYIKKNAPMLSTENKLVLLRIISNTNVESVFSDLPTGTAIDLEKLKNEIIIHLYQFIRHVRVMI